MGKKITSSLGLFMICALGQLAAADSKALLNGITLLEKKNYVQAIDAFNLALKETPANAFIWERRGYAYFCIEDYYQSINDFTLAIILLPQNASFHLQRALAYMKTENANAMKNDLISAAKLGNTHAQEFLQKHGIAWN